MNSIGPLDLFGLFDPIIRFFCWIRLVRFISSICLIRLSDFSVGFDFGLFYLFFGLFDPIIQIVVLFSNFFFVYLNRFAVSYFICWIRLVRFISSSVCAGVPFLSIVGYIIPHMLKRVPVSPPNRDTHRGFPTPRACFRPWKRQRGTRSYWLAAR